MKKIWIIWVVAFVLTGCHSAKPNSFEPYYTWRGNQVYWVTQKGVFILAVGTTGKSLLELPRLLGAMNQESLAFRRERFNLV